MISVTDLCGADLCLCMEEAVCSYLLRGARVCLCEKHLEELVQKTGLSRKELAAKLPDFEEIP